MSHKNPLVLTGGRIQQMQSGDYLPGYRSSGGRNAIINGNFDIWQRGTTFAAPVSASYTADRWRVNISATSGVAAVIRSTSVPTWSLDTCGWSTYAALIDCSTADASVGSGDQWHFEQLIEGYVWRKFYGRPLVLSFWVQCNKAGTYCVALQSASGDRTFVAEYTVTSTSAYEKKTIVIPANTTGTFAFEDTAGASLKFVMMAGSSFHGSTGWASSSAIATSNQANLLDNTNNYMLLSQVQLEVGDVATPFYEVDWQDELNRCLRYYYKTFQYTQAPAENTGAFSGGIFVMSQAAAQFACWVQFPVPMRTTPTCTTYNPGSTGSGWRNLNASSNLARTFESTSAENVGVTGATAPAGTSLNYIHLTASAEL